MSAGGDGAVDAYPGHVPAPGFRPHLGSGQAGEVLAGEEVPAHQTGDNRRAVTSGAADTGGVIVTAAAIMACVFASFGLAGVRTISEFGVGLAVAVLADAFLLRMTVVPALMHLIGRRNWAIPSWLDRVLPQLSVEAPATDSPARPAGQHRTPVAVDLP
jgi:uncharacterized membrane protein YdfJ with MMPL/SSD domain